MTGGNCVLYIPIKTNIHQQQKHSTQLQNFRILYSTSDGGADYSLACSLCESIISIAETIPLTSTVERGNL